MKQPSAKKRRARVTTEIAKQERCDALLSSAALLFASQQFDDVSVAEIAKGAELAKGTIYLYFETKEALFLRLLSEEMTAWFDDPASALKGSLFDSRDVVRIIASGLKKRPVLPRLLGLLHPILERNVDGKTLLAFKSRLLTLTTDSAILFEKSLSLPPSVGVRLTLWMHSLTIGLAQIALPVPAIRSLLQANDSLSAFQIDFQLKLRLRWGPLFSGVQMNSDRKKARRRRSCSVSS
jgi:AcrR family transcriptional regulator